MASSTRFKFVERGQKDTLVLIPGWASDWRIFSGLDLDFNYLLAVEFSPFSFSEDLLAYLSGISLTGVSLLGWSLGGFLASEFAAAYPELVERLFLVSIRKNYPSAEIDAVREALLKNRRGYLVKFYTRCFYSREERRRFKRDYQTVYCNEFGLDHLLNGLDYLATVRLLPQSILPIKKVTIIHGEFDKIAPLAEAEAIANELPHSQFIQIKDTGHLPLLAEDFVAGRFL